MSSSRARATISCTLSTERIWPGIFFSMLWHWSSINAAVACRAVVGAAPDHLDHDPEQLERVGRADDQVVVGVEAAVEVERAELAEPGELGDDELDVGARRVVAGVEADDGTLTEGGAVHVRRAPVRDVGVVERRLEELVLQHQPLVPADLGVDLGEALGQPLLAGQDVGLAGVVGAVREPDLQVARAGRVHHLDAVEVVLHGLLADRRVGVGQAAELVVVVLEGVRVDGAEGDAVVLGVRAQGGVVVDPVPRDVQRHRGGQPGEPVHGGRVGDLLLDGPRGAGRAEHLEPGPGVAVGPGGHLDGQLLEPSGDVGEGGHRVSPWSGRVMRAGPRGGRPPRAMRTPGRA